MSCANTAEPSPRCWWHCHLLGSSSTQSPAQEPWVCQAEGTAQEGFGRSPLQAAWDEEQPQIWGWLPDPRVSLAAAAPPFGACCGIATTISRARFNFCPVAVGKLDPNDKLGLVLLHWVGACIQQMAIFLSFYKKISRIL